MSRTTISAGALMLCAALAAAFAMGLRQSFGLFLAPMTAAHAWTASGFALALAVQVLLNGVSQPLCGQLADRIGGRPVLLGGAALYALGIAGMALSEGLPLFTFFAGLVLGVAVSAAGMPIIIASLARLLPESQRSRAIGIGTAGSSFGQFLVVPLVQGGISLFGWQGALYAMAAGALLVVPFALPLNDRPAPHHAAAGESAGAVLRRAFGEPTFWCLFMGFFVCGLHVAFLTIHLPGFVASCHLPAYVGAGAISLIGLFNVVGSLGAGELAQRWRRRELLMLIYGARAVLMAGFMLLPKTTATVLGFSAIMGVLWLSTVPPTVALCVRNYGVRWLGTVYGLIFLGHQIGGFVGGVLGGVVFDRTGSYDLMWIIAILFGVFGVLINLPVRDAPPALRPALA